MCSNVARGWFIGPVPASSRSYQGHTAHQLESGQPHAHTRHTSRLGHSSGCHSADLQAPGDPGHVGSACSADLVTRLSLASIPAAMGLFTALFGSSYRHRARRDQNGLGTLLKNAISPLNSYGTCFSCNGSGAHELGCRTCDGGGQVQFDCRSCSGDGVRKGACMTCSGTGNFVRPAQPCFRCGGSGRVGAIACSRCGGNGQHREARTELCRRCYGVGRYEAQCRRCVGRGKVTFECSRCEGSGKRSFECRKCGGGGWHKF